MMILLFKVPRNKVKNTIAICSTTILASLLCCIGLPKSANAATFFTRYDLGGSNINSASFIDYEGINEDTNLNDPNAPSLRVTASEDGAEANIRRLKDGLGVFGSGEVPNIGQKLGQIDGINGGFEELLLSFDQTVRIVSASFTSKKVQGNDGFKLLVDGNTLLTLQSGLNNLENNTFNFSSFSAGERTGSKFTFTVSQGNDDYRLESVTVATDIPESSSVPSLLAVGLIGVASCRKVKNF